MKFIIAALLSTFALAHFNVIYPAARGENEALEGQAPCGGGVLGKRTEVPLSGRGIGVKSYHAGTTFNFKLSLAPNPTKQGDFTKNIGKTLGGDQGEKYTEKIDYSASGAKVGQLATIQITAKDHKGTTYRCVDVKFISP
jgi:hypothetical protein